MSNNIPQSIITKIGQNLHNQKNHPLELIKKKIYAYFQTLERNFKTFDDLNPYVSVVDNFDKLLIPKDHPARSMSDTYYLNSHTVLRTQTSAHQNQLLAQGETSFLVTGDVYRKDEIDRSHYPVFHQMEGVYLVPENMDPKKDLLNVLTDLVKYLFPGCQFRINDDYFPFTNPSFEIEVFYNQEWLEILGCGVIHKKILQNNNLGHRQGWAFGLGLERLAMILFQIPDIRYFWETSPKFLDQFNENQTNIKFKPYSNLDPIYKDISFYINNQSEIIEIADQKNWTQINNFYELVRGCSQDLIESVELKDKFFHPKKKKLSHMFRIKFNPTSDTNDPAKLKKQALQIMEKVKKQVTNKLNVEIR